MKRTTALLLAAVLLLSGCSVADPAVLSAELDTPQPPAGQLLDAALASCGEDVDGRLERLDGDDPEYLAAYVEAAYGLAQDQWDDCVVVREGGASAVELAVLRLSERADVRKAEAALEDYLTAREGDFTGYEPAQAELVSRGRVARSGPYIAVFICQDPQGAEEALADAYQAAVRPAPEATQTAQTPEPGPAFHDPVPPSEGPLPEPSDNPSPGPSQSVAGTFTVDPPASVPPEDTGVSYPGRVTFVRPGKDDMSIYDTSAILAAWAADDPSGLSDYDRAIYDSAREVLAEVLEDGMSELEKEIAVYGWLLRSVDYDWSHDDVMAVTPRESFTPYGGLVNHTAVCLGFAASFQTLMDLSGVECITVVGAAHRSTGDHAWNMVRLNGNWYCVDTTWDRGPNADDPSCWSFFNVTSDYMARTDHQWDYDNIPEATARDGGRG